MDIALLGGYEHIVKQAIVFKEGGNLILMGKTHVTRLQFLKDLSKPNVFYYS